MYETQFHFVLLIDKPIKRLVSPNTKTDTAMTTHISTTQTLVLVCSQFHLLINRSPTHFLSSSLCLFVLSQSQTQSSSAIPRCHSLSEVFGLSLYYFIHAFINYLRVHFCITYSLLFCCNILETIQLDIKINTNKKIIVLGCDAVGCCWNFLTHGTNVGKFLPDNMTSRSRIILVRGFRRKNFKLHRKSFPTLN